MINREHTERGSHFQQELHWSQSASMSMREIEQTIVTVAPTNVSVVLIGEQGTGKERLARRIHALSPRSHRELVTIDCSAFTSEQIDRELFGSEDISWEGISIEKGAFGLAEGGTLLLDDFQVLPRSLQLKVARISEYGFFAHQGSRHPLPVDVRLILAIVATGERNDPMGQLLDEVYHRLSPIVIEIPALRTRPEDIPPLIHHFLKEFEQKSDIPLQGIAEETVKNLVEYRWPGNVRHLKNAVEYACVMSKGQLIMPEHLPNYLAKVR